MKLFEIVKKYLETNGISIRYFSDCIGVSPNVGGKWLRGDIKKSSCIRQCYGNRWDQCKASAKICRIRW